MKKRQLTLSIVIPAYNEEHHLRACLQSIANQTVQPDEVIVVDNNSTDRTAEIAASFPFVRVVRENKQGLVHARNHGFDTVSCGIIGRIDADSILPNTWVQHILAFYAQPANHNKAWSGAGVFYNVYPSRLVSWAYQLLAFRFNKLLLGHNLLWGSNTALLRSQWLAVRDQTCDRVDMHEDLDLAMHIASHGYGITYGPTVRVQAELRRVHDDRQKLWEYLQLWPRTLQIHGKKNWPVCWFFGAFLLYLATFVLLIIELSGRILEGSLATPLTKTARVTSQDFPKE